MYSTGRQLDNAASESDTFCTFSRDVSCNEDVIPAIANKNNSAGVFNNTDNCNAEIQAIDTDLEPINFQSVEGNAINRRI